MKWGVVERVLIAAVVFCVFDSGISQDPTDINRGCYFDQSDRALTDLITCEDGRPQCHDSCGMEHRYCQSVDMMTIDFCRTLCRNRNLRYYALQAGNQCFCGGALSDPFKYGSATGAGTTCSSPCSGDANKTCGGEFKNQVYEYQEPVVNTDCFHPGFVQNAYISANSVISSGEKISFICLPRHTILGDPEITCQADGSWSPNTLPICNYTGILEQVTEDMTDPMTTQETVTVNATTTAIPRTTISDLLPYIIGGSAALVFILVVCLVGIFVCRRRKQYGNSRQDIRLKPDPAPVTFINTGFHNEDEDEDMTKVDMPDILPATGNISSPTTENNLYRHRTSTFSEDPIYQNSDVAGANGLETQTVYENEEKEPLSPRDTNPPSPIYANAEAALPNGGTEEGYTKRYSRNGYATTDRPAPNRGSSSNDPVFVYATDNRRAKKNATGTKDLVGWSRPSSLYQRTSPDDDDDESIEDNNVIDPTDLSQAVYAQIDKSMRAGSKETLTSEHSGNSSFADPAKSSATRL